MLTFLISIIAGRELIEVKSMWALEIIFGEGPMNMFVKKES